MLVMDAYGEALHLIAKNNSFIYYDKNGAPSRHSPAEMIAMYRNLVSLDNSTRSFATRPLSKNGNVPDIIFAQITNFEPNGYVYISPIMLSIHTDGTYMPSYYGSQVNTLHNIINGETLKEDCTYGELDDISILSFLTRVQISAMHACGDRTHYTSINIVPPNMYEEINSKNQVPPEFLNKSKDSYSNCIVQHHNPTMSYYVDNDKIGSGWRNQFKQYNMYEPFDKLPPPEMQLNNNGNKQQTTTPSQEAQNIAGYIAGTEEQLEELSKARQRQREDTKNTDNFSAVLVQLNGENGFRLQYPDGSISNEVYFKQ